MAPRAIVSCALILLIGAVSVRTQNAPCPDGYCFITPNNRTLCPETPENKPPNRVDTTLRVAALREAMKNVTLTGGSEIHALLIYEGSYYGGGVTEHDRKLQYISGFSGSSGYAIVTGVSGSAPNRAGVWTDGRYFLQGDQELDCVNWNLMKQSMPGYPEGPAYLAGVLPPGSRVGADPNVVGASTFLMYKQAMEEAGIVMVELEHDLFDYIWTEDRPPKSNELIYIHSLTYSGKAWQDKLADVRQKIDGVTDWLILNLLDDVAWLFNLRGWDRPTSPLFDCIAMVHKDEVRLYLNNHTRLLGENGIQAHLNTNADGTCGGTPNCVIVRELNDAVSDIQALSDDTSVQAIWIESAVTYAIYNAVNASKRYEAQSPVQLMKSTKTRHERDHYYQCQLRDSATLCEFAAFLEKEIDDGNAWTEVSAAEKLKEMRSKDPLYKMLSFDSIAGFGPNGAVIHYRPSAATDLPITKNGLFLLDSGGNYLDGTTDVTRTFHYGNPTAEEINRYTLVLLGAIDLATTVWPEGLYGRDIDGRTRTPLWQQGLDYNHGTGHGIGFFLNVHEGPGRINIGYNAAHSPLYEGMFFSDEPGFYKDGAFGIRLETIVGVENANTTNTFNDKKYLTFKPFTLVPFETKLIDLNMLESSHRRWLNAYHLRCLEETGKYLQDTGRPEAYEWIRARTEPVPEVAYWSTSAAPSFGLSVSFVAAILFTISQSLARIL